MKKFIFFSAVAMMIGACVIPVTFTPAPNPSPIVDTAGTAESIMKTAVVQTLTAQSTGTNAPVVISTTPTSTSEASPSPTETSTPVIDPTFTAATGTFEVPTSTDVPATIPGGPVTHTSTPGVLTYGTLPPAVPFSNVTLINRAKTQAYISLQVVTAEGGPTIIEYPVSGQIKIKAPIGHYLYVAWVGGRKMVGEFRLHRDEDLSVILYRDRIEIK
jgi:hypothetical protein